MKISLLPGAPTSINCKVYPLNQKETEILKEFLEEEEKKGYIKPGSSPYTAPVFFVRKKDSEELRPVMDYRELNKWTIKDNNPLPNIRTALESLRGGELFSKFDLRWGYKNLRVKAEDQYKAAFKTIFGTYIPAVTYFGLTNAPPTFQRVITEDLRPILQRYPRNVGNYLDDACVANYEVSCVGKRACVRELYERQRGSLSITRGRHELCINHLYERQRGSLLVMSTGVKSWGRVLESSPQYHAREARTEGAARYGS